MMIIDHRKFIKPPAVPWYKRWLRFSIYGLTSLIILAFMVNGVMWLAYRHRVLPRYSLSGVAVGNVAFSDIQKHVEGKILPEKITLQKNTVSRAVPTSSLGVSVDTKGSIADLQTTRPLFPIISLFVRHDVPARVSIDAAKYTSAAASLKPVFAKEALSKRVVFDGTKFTIAPAEDGYQLDPAGLQRDIVNGLGKGRVSFTVATTPMPAAHTSTDLNAVIAALQKKLTLKPAFTYNGKTVNPTAKDIGNWYGTKLDVMELSADKIGAYLDSIAPAAANRSDLILAVQYALGKDQSLNLAVVPQGSLTHTYCTNTRGVSGASLDDMIGKIAATYADTRGWNDGGRIAFNHVASGCEYTVWLSAPSQMTTFGDICDDYYNCQAGSNVVVNDDRWEKATPPWNDTNGTLENYRTLIIDHETGHRLGFYDNPTCPAAGQPAPVMMQQSIDLKGCTFNVWPLPTELSTLAANLNLPPQTSND